MSIFVIVPLRSDQQICVNWHINSSYGTSKEIHITAVCSYILIQSSFSFKLLVRVGGRLWKSELRFTVDLIWLLGETFDVLRSKTMTRRCLRRGLNILTNRATHVCLNTSQGRCPFANSAEKVSSWFFCQFHNRFRSHSASDAASVVPRCFGALCLAVPLSLGSL